MSTVSTASAFRSPLAPAHSCSAGCANYPLPADLHVPFDEVKTTIRREKGEVLFHEFEPCHSVFVVTLGRMKLITSSREGNALILRFAGPGDVLGAAEALHGTAYGASAIVLEPVVLAAVPRDTFLRFINTYPAAAFWLTGVLSEQYTAAQRQAKFIAFGQTSAARLARRLLEWSSEHGRSDTDGIHIPMQVTHSDLAQATSSTRETITRVLRLLRDRGVVERKPDEVVIRKPDELKRLAMY